MAITASWVGKVGGSLLESPGVPDLESRIESVVAERGGPHPILIMGGGPTVDLIRGWDRRFGFDEEFCHWVSVQAMTLNSRILARILARGRLVGCEVDCEQAWARGEISIYDAYRFLKEVDEDLADSLPRRWTVTSDSIAARIARQFSAGELALLKSTTLPEVTSLTRAVDEGFVDPYFATAARDLTAVVAINLCEIPARVSRLAGPARS